MNAILIPILIFFARVVDVSMGTLRIVFISRGIKLAAAVLGFFEILIWLLAISQIMKNLSSPWHYLAYASGFGLGNYVGITIEQRLCVGTLLLRVIIKEDPAELVSALIFRGFGVTSVDARGATGPVQMVFTVLRRKELDDAIDLIERHAPKSFYTVEDLRQAAPRDFLRGIRSSHEEIYKRLRGQVLKRK